jgi:superfamily II DNA or RNA helicase
MGDFITNRDGVFLSEIIKSILPAAQNASFLVGYFYFSGFPEIYQGLKDKALRVLVGLEIEQDMMNHVREVEYRTEIKRTRGEIKATYYDSLNDLFNDTEYFDSDKKKEAFSLFYNKIKEGSLEIRKTKEANHAKMYLFQNIKEIDQGGTYPGTLITGSSNLSLAGLKKQLELDAIFRTKSDYEEGRQIFDELWETAIVIADKDHKDDFEKSVIDKIWYEKLYKPYCFFLRVLDEYFKNNYDKDFKTANEINNNFYDLKYQTDAIKIALKTIEEHNGAIISDVVGLGKSIIGSVVAHNMSLRTIIIAPPHLVPQWEDYSADFNFHAKVFSSGKIESALRYFKEKASFGKPWLIIIDEAHKYRNEQTADYKNLHDLCRANKVMLLTATPFNNRPADIYSMVKLFQIPLKSTLKNIDNFGFRFQELIIRYNELRSKQRKKDIDEDALRLEIDAIAANIRKIISPLVIRRSRLDLMKITEYKNDLKKQNMGFAETGDPQALEYDLGGIKDLYLSTLQQISPDIETGDGRPSYQAARYNAVHYVKLEFKEKLTKIVESAGIEYNLFIGSQTNLSKFMRRLLVQRFESSKKAFELSLNRMIETTKNILYWISKRGKVPVFKKGSLPDIEDYYSDAGSSDELYNENYVDTVFEEELNKFETKGLFELETEYFEEAFIEDIKSDIHILETIKENWFGEGKNLPDPKRDHFAEIIKREITNDPGRKIVIFSSYADTVNDLYKKLQSSKLRVFKYTSKESSKKNKETIERNFDAGKKIQDNDYDVLVATDAISEGYNLHRAGTVINYDIPYNPTRVIQRVGRINRINKKVFDRLYIYNYFPTSIGEGETRTKEISTLKMAMINAIIGEDTKVLTGDIELKSFFAQQYRKLLAENEAESWKTKYYEILNNAKGTKEYEMALAIPHRSRIARTIEKSRKGVLLFGRKKDACVFKISKSLLDSDILDPEDAFKLLEANILEQPKPVSQDFDAVYQNMKQTLFKTSIAEKTDKQKRDVLDKIKIISDAGIFNSEYIDSLRKAAEVGALSGLTMQFIRQLAPKDFASLSQEIDQDFLDRIQKMASDIDEGSECIILSEELL